MKHKASTQTQGATGRFSRTLHFSASARRWSNVKKEYPDAELMLLEVFAKRKVASQRSPWEWEETTEEAYDYGLEVLPPAYFKYPVFMVGEPYDHYADTGEATYQAFKRNKDGYWKSSRAISVRELEGMG